MTMHPNTYQYISMDCIAHSTNIVQLVLLIFFPAWIGKWFSSFGLMAGGGINGRKNIKERESKLETG